ncbi:hypothetical protein D3C87_1774890 [compost metagenome]
MTKLRSVSNKIRPLADTMACWKSTIARFSGAERTTLAARFRQVLIEAERIIFLAVNEPVDRFGGHANRAYSLRQQTPGDLLGRPSSLELTDDVGSQIRMASQLAQASSSLAGQLISDRPEVTGVLGKVTVMEGVATDFAIDG